MRIAAAGFCCIDVYNNLKKYYPTGNGVDFAVHMNRLGYASSLISAVGNDSYGELMKETLKKEGIDISHLHTLAGSTAVIQLELNGNDRVHGDEDEGVMEQFSLTQKDIDFILTHDYLHTDLFGRILNRLPFFQSSGLKTVFDFSTFLQDERIERILPSVDYAFFSYEQEDNFIRDYMKWAKNLGPSLVTVTLGEHGSLSYDGQAFHKGESIPVDVVNTVGAGDSFIAGFIHGIIRGQSIPDCLKSGATLASSVITQFEPY
ncbi:fructoselysine 6-kinase [Domibacillus sp. DTU_2020_1001157_1_SI_ALB_TIR_016]|uniref:fructoselysine 6-kinase n=1 Tax=Domibacillus sp. DTU_2020_1001157_1_SI_ALB_TIR_016 TaxID=3077789 RepID=UPI0028F11CE9|nr:fructoselysine 6-kinase [Domibacillus sp. DTU_2020_1001157_1_SI_ALB_TIR_016]WNS79235.1 fructoselysine 6-kinase [Domibacillus sp. DTU_2020_1001157_1_SI_ALB_TIR_016]